MLGWNRQQNITWKHPQNLMALVACGLVVAQWISRNWEDGKLLRNLPDPDCQVMDPQYSADSPARTCKRSGRRQHIRTIQAKRCLIKTGHKY
eukprot:6124385-Amphidinium_carterae.1